MLQIPRDIIHLYPQVQVKHTKMYAIALPVPLATNEVLQTTHCLELVLSGSNAIHSGLHCDKITTGDIHFRKKGNYQLAPSPDYSALLIFIENEFVLDFLKEHITTYSNEVFDTGLPPFNFRQSEFIQAHIKEALATINHPGTYASCIIRLAAHQVLLHMLDNEKSTRFVSFLQYLVTDRKIDLAYFMEEHFASRMDVKELAVKSGRSLSTFKKDFHTTFGTTPMRWLINRRLEHAKYLLSHTNDSNISGIAYNCGFENLAHFSKVYRLKFGITPSLSKNQ
jgi:AraC family transcriptional regulator, exoenzyme S synthesis regulatory protein ExsA